MTWRGTCSPTQSALEVRPRTCTTTAASTSTALEDGQRVASRRARRISGPALDQLGRRGVIDELRAVDLAQFTRHGHVIDTLRDRVVFQSGAETDASPASSAATSVATPRAPKYRNPAHTPVFDKSLILYRPTWPRLVRRRRWSSSKDHWTPSPSPPPQPTPT